MFIASHSSPFLFYYKPFKTLTILVKRKVFWWRKLEESIRWFSVCGLRFKLSPLPLDARVDWPIWLVHHQLHVSYGDGTENIKAQDKKQCLWPKIFVYTEHLERKKLSFSLILSTFWRACNKTKMVRNVMQCDSGFKHHNSTPCSEQSDLPRRVVTVFINSLYIHMWLVIAFAQISRVAAYQ
jgi:hypothetical protein